MEIYSISPTLISGTEIHTGNHPVFTKLYSELMIDQFYKSTSITKQNSSVGLIHSELLKGILVDQFSKQIEKSHNMLYLENIQHVEYQKAK